MVSKMDRLYDDFVGDEEKKMTFMQAIYAHAGQVPSSVSAPLLSAQMLSLLEDYMEDEDPYRAIKSDYNKKLLALEETMEKAVEGAEDPLVMALKYAMVGNFIDFGAMDQVDDDRLEALIKGAPSMDLDANTCQAFKAQLKHAKSLVYLGDNAGEIVMDKLLIRRLLKDFPQLSIRFVVRGGPVFNDITLRDSREVGLDKLVTVLSNGTRIPGTDLSQINKESRQALKEADLILAKGQGNFESLAGCGLAVYYLFLCKCRYFTQRFGMGKYEGVFAYERTLSL